MHIQIFGDKKSKDSAKAERFFKERGIIFHYRELSEDGISEGELDSICKSIPIYDLIDKTGKEFRKRDMQFMVYDTREELLTDAKLFRTPIVRNEHRATVGYQPDIWLTWIK